MASNIYQRTTVTGTTWHTRKGTQGRRKSGLPLVTRKIIWNVTEEQKNEFSEFAKNNNMSESKMVDLLVSIGKYNFLNQIIG